MNKTKKSLKLTRVVFFGPLVLELSDIITENKMNLIKCNSCEKEFTPTTEQLNFIYESKEKGMTFIMLKCNKCGLSFSFNPLSI